MMIFIFFIKLLLTILIPSNENTDSLKKLEVVNQSVELETTKNELLGKIDYSKSEKFTTVDFKYLENKKTLYLRKKTCIAFQQMYEAAKKDGIDFIIVSGARDFYHQKRIWNGKWKRYESLKPLERAKKILEYSSMPSSSRHHWGTDIDLNNLENEYFESGKGKKEYDWLTANANKFGFYQVYKTEDRSGYNVEKWHWSYMPIAEKNLKLYNEKVKYKDITGFEGSELAEELGIIELYVNGIDNDNC